MASTTKESRFRETIKNNPPATAAGLTAAVTAFLTAVILWATSMLPASIPLEVVASGLGIVWIFVALIGAAVGKAAQTWTWPDHRVQDQLSAETFLAQIGAAERRADPDAAARQAAELDAGDEDLRL